MSFFASASTVESGPSILSALSFSISLAALSVLIGWCEGSWRAAVAIFVAGHVLPLLLMVLVLSFFWKDVL